MFYFAIVWDYVLLPFVFFHLFRSGTESEVKYGNVHLFHCTNVSLIFPVTLFFSPKYLTACNTHYKFNIDYHVSWLYYSSTVLVVSKHNICLLFKFLFICKRLKKFKFLILRFRNCILKVYYIRVNISHMENTCITVSFHSLRCAKYTLILHLFIEGIDLPIFCYHFPIRISNCSGGVLLLLFFYVNLFGTDVLYVRINVCCMYFIFWFIMVYYTYFSSLL